MRLVKGCGSAMLATLVLAGSAAGATLVVPEVVVGHRAGVAWLTTVSVPPPAMVSIRPFGVMRRTSPSWL